MALDQVSEGTNIRQLDKFSSLFAISVRAVVQFLFKLYNFLSTLICQLRHTSLLSLLIFMKTEFTISFFPLRLVKTTRYLWTLLDHIQPFCKKTHLISCCDFMLQKLPPCGAKISQIFAALLKIWPKMPRMFNSANISGNIQQQQIMVSYSHLEECCSRGLQIDSEWHSKAALWSLEAVTQ